MTRFARAKGSTASNEKVPEAATPWSIMKQQLLEKKNEDEIKDKREELNAQRMESYNKFLKEHEEKEGKNVKWADFPGIQKPEKQSKVKKLKVKEKLLMGAKKMLKPKTNNEINANEKSESDSDEEFNILKKKLDTVLDQMENQSDSEFPEVSSEMEVPEAKHTKAKQKKKLKILSQSGSNETHDTDKEKQGETKSDPNVEKGGETSEKKKKKKQKKQSTIENQDHLKENLKTTSEKINTESGTDREGSNAPKKKNKKQKKRLAEENENDEDVGVAPLKKKLKKTNPDSETNGKIINTPKMKSKAVSEDKQNKEKSKKSKKANNKNDKTPITELDEATKKKLDKKQQKKQKQWENRQLKKAQKQAEKESQTNQSPQKSNANKQNISKTQNEPGRQPNDRVPPKDHKPKKNLESSENGVPAKKKKFKEDKARRKPVGPDTMIINGETVAVELVDGFPIQKADAERLRQLRKQMISKGLPRSEINKALKLERRRAEKALTKLKRTVCFNCRKAGHNLSDCPEVGNEFTASVAVGICFKCGSTEHKSFECKVVRNDSFKHATCFICKEQGHITRQCPDNPRGLYPNGGACNVCGDVTHLKKDCPEYQARQQQDNSVKVDVMNESNPDDLGDISQKKIDKKPANKVIKF